MERDLEVSERSGSFDIGGSVELVATGGFGPVNETEILITIALLLLLGIVFSLSSTGQMVFNAIDSFGRAVGPVNVTGGGGGAEFTVENR